MSIGIVLLTGVMGCLGFFCLTSFFEWTLHKYIMHTALWQYPFHAHALVHHGLFRADRSHHIQPGVDQNKVRFAWWNAPGLYLLHVPLLLTLVYFFGWAVFWGGTVGLFSYYVLYESLHWCMHVPKDRWVERTQIFHWLNAHHFLHHRYAYKNLNVVLPLADWLFGSLVSISKLTAEESRQLTATPTAA